MREVQCTVISPDVELDDEFKKEMSSSGATDVIVITSRMAVVVEGS